MKILIGKAGKQEVKLDLEVLLSTRMLLTADSGGGKTFALKRIVEQASGKIQILIVDPEGEFAPLREHFNFVLVGKGGETPADVRSAETVGQTLLKLGASAICDIYEMKPTTRHEWVAAFLNGLIEAPKQHRHPCLVIVDEAHMFCPERGKGESVATEAMRDLCTRGRKRLLCALFATQRLATLNKDASSMLLNRMIGPTFEDLNRKRAAEVLSITKEDQHEFNKQIQLLEPGNFFALGRAISKERVLVHVAEIQSAHGQEALKYELSPPPPPEKIKALLPKLADLPKQAEEQAKTVAEFKAQIRSLKAQLRSQSAGKPVEVKVADTQAIARSVMAATAEYRKLLGANASAFRQIAQNLEQTSVIAGRQAGKGMPSLPAMKILKETIPPVQVKEKKRDAFQALRENTVRRPTMVVLSDTNNGDLPEGERAVLQAIAKYEEGLERHQITVLTGYKRSTRDAYVARLRPKEFIDERGGRIFATQKGIAALGEHYEAMPPSGDELQRYWLERLPDGEKKLLRILLEGSGQEFDREFLTEQTGYKRSTRDAYLARMLAKHIIEADRGKVKAVEQFFL